MTRNEAIIELKKYTKVTNAAWRIMMNGSEEDASTVFGKQGKNYLAWCKAADAECAFRVEHELCDYPTKRRSN